MPKATVTASNHSNASPLPPVEEIAQAIVDISAAAKKLMGGRLKEDAIVILLQAMSGGVNRSDIRVVLRNLRQMDQYWLKPLPKKESK
jgi:hypothetical protein